MTRYSEEELLAALQELAADIGQTPSVNDLHSRDDLPSRSTYRDRFGSWNDALQAAGLDPNQPYAYSRSELLQAIEETATESDGRPTRREVQTQTGISEAPFRREFGSWAAAMEAAGYSRAPRIPTADLVEALREFANYYGVGHAVSPTKREMDDAGPYSHSVYVDRFGSWTQAVVQAGLNPDTRRIPRADLLAELQRLEETLGRRPTWADMEQEGSYSGWPYLSEFGSWRAALVEAGYEPPAGGRPQGTGRYSPGELVAELRRIARKWGRPPSASEFDDHSELASSTYLRRFGDWNSALERAGLAPRRESTSARVDAAFPVADDDGDGEFRMTVDGAETVIRAGDGIGDRRSRMSYEVREIDADRVSGWPVGFRGDLRRDFPREELETALGPRTEPVQEDPRRQPRLLFYPSWHRDT
jgi:hypothetical protein